MSLHALDNLCLSASDVFTTAEKTDMACAYIGNDGDCGTTTTRQACNLTFVVHAAFTDQDLSILGSRKDRHGKPNEIVMVTGGGMNAPLRCNTRSQHIFRGGFANGSGNRHYRPILMERSPGSGQAEKKFFAVIPLGSQKRCINTTGVFEGGLSRLFTCAYYRSSRIKCGIYIGVSVDLLARKCNKERAFAHTARIDLHLTGKWAFSLNQKRRSRRLKYVARGHTNHATSHLLARRWNFQLRHR